MDQTKSSWWASDPSHLHNPTETIYRQRDVRMKQFILDSMDIHRPYIIFLELRRQGYDVSLKSVQMSVYRAKKDRWTNDIETCSQIVQARIYRIDLLDAEPFYFGPQAVPGCFLGSGDKNDPLILGIASRYTLSSLRFLEAGAVLCIDGTYGLNDRKYPVVVYGVTDWNHSFHLVAIFIVSQEIIDVYKTTIAALSSVSLHVCGIEMSPSIVLSDGSLAIARAVAEKFPAADHLMCYAHMMNAVTRHLQAQRVNAETANIVKTGLRKMHLAQSAEHFLALQSQIIPTWPAEISSYIQTEWIRGSRCKWQVYHAKVGCARSNQGTESCNNMIKKFYTLRKVSKLSECMQKLSGVIEGVGDARKPFATCRKFKKPFLKTIANQAKDFFIAASEDLAVVLDDGVEYCIRKSDRACQCGLFMKETICPHLHKAFSHWKILEEITNNNRRPLTFVVGRSVGRPSLARRQRR